MTRVPDNVKSCLPHLFTKCHIAAKCTESIVCEMEEVYNTVLFYPLYIRSVSNISFASGCGGDEVSG